MRELIKTKLIPTKWGRAIDLGDIINLTNYIDKKIDGKILAFLDYSGNHKDFEIEEEYNCEIFYSRWYFGRIDKQNRKATVKDAKDHIKIVKDTLEECDKEFERVRSDKTYGLEENISDRRTQAYFRIIEE